MTLSSLLKFRLLNRKKFLRRQAALLQLICFLFPSLSHISRSPNEQARIGLTFICSLCSLATSRISCTYSPNPNCSKAFVICSQAIVFLLSFSLISFASDEMRVMNSTQHSIRRSRASFPNARPDVGGRISVTIFCTVAMGICQ
jgi:hypothetical protein